MSEIMLSVAQVLALAPGDDKNASWINPGFTAFVSRLEEKTSQKGKKYYPCTLRAVNGEQTIEASFFAAPAFKEGDVVEFSGKGLRRTEYNGNAQVSTGKETAIRVLPGAPRQAPPPQTNNRRAEDPAPPGDDNPAAEGTIFHNGMKKNALLWIHCWRYAGRIQEKLGVVFQPEQNQALVSTLFIESCKQGLRSCVPPLAGSPKATPPPQSGRDDPAPRREDNTDDSPDEDVPF